MLIQVVELFNVRRLRLSCFTHNLCRRSPAPACQRPGGCKESLENETKVDKLRESQKHKRGVGGGGGTGKLIFSCYKIWEIDKSKLWCN